MDNWISIEDRLPAKEGGFVRVVGGIKGNCPWSGEVLYNPKTSGFQTTNFIILDATTHWMPLPQPPSVTEE